MEVFGPVPSRRLGHSLGINFIPPKTCSYACVYCQLGRRIRMQTKRASFEPPKSVAQQVGQRLHQLMDSGEEVDYLTLIPDGEPTLDMHLGDLIEHLKPLGIPIAVITNGSLISDAEVRHALMGADWVSLKVDAVWEDTWRKVNRPHRNLHLPDILEGMTTFAAEYAGTLTTETMLVQDTNDNADHLSELAQFVSRLAPTTSYLAIPTRPPAEAWVLPPTDAGFHTAYQLFRETMEHVEALIGYEGNAFAATGNAAQDLLSITAVHPMREDAVQAILDRCHASESVLADLLASGQLVDLTYGKKRFYLRCLQSPPHTEEPT